MLEEIQVEQYFTMVFAEVDLRPARSAWCRPGHPHPADPARRSAEVERLGTAGLPVGLIARRDAMTGCRLSLRPGRPAGSGVGRHHRMPAADTATNLGEEGLTDSLAPQRPHLSGPDLLEALVWDLASHAGSDVDFPTTCRAWSSTYLGP